MDVFVIINTDKYTKDDVVRDIKEEGYKHNFFFANFNDVPVSMKQLENADEIWVFGDCIDQTYYKVAKEKGKEIWQML